MSTATSQTMLNGATVEKNLELWQRVQQTDPDHTKPVKIGRNLTAIDSYYQIKRATEQFGPAGIGWGWEAEEEWFLAGPCTMAKVTLKLWYVRGTTKNYVGPVIAMNKIASPNDNGKIYVDDEAFKKATTDCITKSLSMLGFSADVFMGLFDSDKYVANRRVEVAREREARAPMPAVFQKVIDGLKDLKSEADLTKAWESMPREDYKNLSPTHREYLQLKFKQRKLEINPEIAPEDQTVGASP